MGIVPQFGGLGDGIGSGAWTIYFIASRIDLKGEFENENLGAKKMPAAITK